ncbi:ABC transporter permease [Galbibacter sp. PAP.153]|uniref:ABC transporter permease n=1 Tax=Galbibacter sp. PAP.153 TaxID=3104623 RepID=UPI0030084CD8
MHKFWASVNKEILLLSKDLGGLVILFIMPIVLIITITLIQDSTFKAVGEIKIPIVLVNNDGGEVSKTILEGMESSGSFNIITITNEEQAREAVHKGTYQIGIVIPENLSANLQVKVERNVNGILERFMGEDSVPINKGRSVPENEIKLYFDPTTQSSFKSAVKNEIDKMIYKIETESIYKAFQDQLSDDSEPIFERGDIITFKEVSPMAETEALVPNSVQHNVPAWTLFAIFFIIVPLSINIVKEKNQGTNVRLRTCPVSYTTIIGGKTAVYLLVCIIQFMCMLGIGVYLFPEMGLPALEISGKIIRLFLVAIAAGTAAIGLGILLGTLAKTQEQSAPFGATFVVILAALGGVWVPVFVMPEFMQALSRISPMNWGLNAFYDVFLRNAGFAQILPEIILLILFFVVTTLIAIIYNEKKNAV